MYEYYILFILGVVLCFIGGRDKCRQFYCATLLIFFMLLMSGFRSLTFNGDTQNYMAMIKYGSDSHSEFLFHLTYKFVSHPRLWLLLIAFLIYIPLLGVLKNEVMLACLGAFLFMISSSKFFTESFNIIRQSIAASFLLCSFAAWKYGKIYRTIILFVVSILFHTSSLIAAPFYFLRSCCFNRKLVILLLLITFIVGYRQLLNEFLSVFIAGLNTYTLGFDGISEILDKYAAYGGDGTSFNKNYIIATILPPTVMCLLTFPRTAIEKAKFGFYYNILLGATCIGNIVIPATQYGFRLTFALSLVQVLVVPIKYFLSTNQEKILLTVFLIFLSALYLYTLPTLMPNYSIS